MLNMLFVILLIMVLLSVAFLTLFERKLLSYMQLRKGPNKIYFVGILQPMSDGLKLLMKEQNKSMIYNKWMYTLFPCFYFMLSLMFWFLFNYFYVSMFYMGFLIFFLLSGMGVYGLMGSGWSSNSKYSLLGSYRSVAQTVSYEVGMVFLLLTMLYFTSSYSFVTLKNFSNMCGMNVYMYLNLCMVWMLVMLAELNRSPFDFAESESELVSGYNVEYGASMFVLLFLSEYMNIIFMSYITMFLFTKMFMLFIMMMIIMFIIWIRGVLPRFRYDNLMYMNWKIFLPISILMVTYELVLDVLFFTF